MTVPLAVGIGLAGIALGVFLILSPGNPHETRLPMSMDGLPKLQARLDRLPAEERQLVLDYMQRSRGSALPADPSAPLTARTFGEAIKLQREFNVKRAAELAARKELQAGREAAFEPLRQVLQVELVRREIVSTDEAKLRRRPLPGRANINSSPTLVVTYRLTNRNPFETITSFSGSVSVGSASDPQASLRPRIRCFFSETVSLGFGQSTEVRCGKVYWEAEADAKAFADMPPESLALMWEPKSIEFASGRTLNSGGESEGKR